MSLAIPKQHASIGKEVELVREETLVDFAILVTLKHIPQNNVYHISIFTHIRICPDGIIVMDISSPILR